MHARVVYVNQEPLGDELTADAAAAATSISVSDISDFINGRQLTIAGEVYDYTYDEDDDTSLTISAGLTADADEGTRVDLWDPTTGAVALETVAGVVFDGFDPADPVEVDIRHDLIPLLALGIRSEPSESVVVERVGGQLMVVEVAGKRPTLDAAFSYAPIYRGVMGIDLSVPTGSTPWTTIQNWFALNSDRTVEVAGIITVQETGLYRCGVGVTWDANTSGVRGLRIIKTDLAGGTHEHRAVQLSAAGAGEVAFETSQLVPMFAGEAVSFETRQTSGASLDLLGSNPLAGDPIRTDCYVIWDRPL